MKPPIVAITGINAVDNPGPGTGVARSIREDKDLDAHIVGLAYDAMEPGLYMDWLFDKRYIMPYPSSEPEATIDRLLQIKDQFGLDCLIPNFDVELPLYIRCADELARHGIVTFLPTREQFRLRSKERLPEIAEAIGVKTPRTEVVTSLTELYEVTEDLSFPLMVKGPFYKAYCVHTPQDAALRFQQLAAEWGYPIIVQEVVNGTELNLVGLGDGLGGNLGMVGIKKMWITELGKIWTGMTVRHPGMQAAAAAFLSQYQWKGPFELECIVDEAGDIYLIEINPRFPAWTYFATGVGTNLPANLVRAALGQPLLESSDYQAGQLFIRYTYEIVTDAAPFQMLAVRGER